MRSTKSTWMHEYFDHQNVGCSCKQGFTIIKGVNKLNTKI